MTESQAEVQRRCDQSLERSQDRRNAAVEDDSKTAAMTLLTVGGAAMIFAFVFGFSHLL